MDTSIQAQAERRTRYLAETERGMVTVLDEQTHAGGNVTIIEYQHRTFEIAINTVLGTRNDPSEYQHEITELLGGPEDMWDQFAAWEPYEVLTTFVTPEEAYEDAVRIIKEEVCGSVV